MPENTQKQIAAKYKNDLTYYKKTHPFRKVRFWASVVLFFGGIIWAIGFSRLGGTPQFFNTGPISQNHEQFKIRCEVCHAGTTTDMLAMFGPKKAHDAPRPLLETLKAAGTEALAAAKEHLGDPKKLADATIVALSALNLENIDAACVSCHKGMALHQPGTKSIMFREGQKELSIVAAGACSSCHREHVGTARMRLPTSETCIDCHGNETKLATSLQRAKYEGSLAAAHGRNVQWGDVVQWLPPSKEGAAPAIVKAFGNGHPQFLYEDAVAKDAANIRFNHARHVKRNPQTGEFEQAENVGKFNGSVLQCSSCHEPDGNGVGMKRIKFENHCASCHGLAPDADLPGFTIPHRDPRKVTDFLETLNGKWREYAGNHYNVKDAVSLNAYLDQRGKRFIEQWGVELAVVTRRVFFDGYPPREKAQSGQTMTACAKCHVVTDAKPVPLVAHTDIPDGWLTRGPFKHAAHLHMNCLDCHGAALESGKGVTTTDVKDTGSTKDILLPSQRLCSECHRPRDYNSVVVNPIERIAPTFGQFSADAAVQQRKEGGVFDSCLGCHKYHVPASEMEIARSLRK